MKFYTADFYNKMQMPLETPIEQVEEMHRLEEKLEEDYKKRIEDIWQQLPPACQYYLDNIHLHDAVFDSNQDIVVSPTPGKLQLVVKQDDWGPEFLCVLRYTLAPAGKYEPVLKVDYHTGAGFDGCELNLWLCDEMDMIEPGVFEHHILLSNGVELQIKFTDFHFIKVPLGKETVEM